MPARRPSILVLDGDVRIVAIVRRTLEMEGYRVMTALPEETFEILDRLAPDLVLLDTMLPGVDGYSLCRRVREFSSVPIMIVTGRSEDRDKVEGFNCGADDYLVKPFSCLELAARVRALLRRVGMPDESGQPFQSDGLVVDFARRRVILHNKEVRLSPTEYGLLAYLSRNADCVLTPDQILQRVWGREYIGESHLLQVSMARLRKKLGDSPRNPAYIATRSGIGYLMVKKNR